MSTIDAGLLQKAFCELLEEVHVGPPNPKTTWLVSNEADSGFVGTLGGISAADASLQPGPGMISIAAHARHLHYALSLLDRAMQGENPYAEADWRRSFQPQAADEAEWNALRNGIREKHERILARIRERTDWSDPAMLQGVMATVGHGAYHLGAIRQVIRFLRATGERSS